MRFSSRLALLIVFATATGIAQSQSTCQFLGSRVLKRVWIEPGVGIALAPTIPFDSGAAGCANQTQALVLTTNPQFKDIHAAALSALTSGTPINAYVCTCMVFWGGVTYPVITAMGVGQD